MTQVTEKNNKSSDPIAPNVEKRKARERAIQDEIDKQAKKYQDGEVLEFVQVRFPGNARSFQFLRGKRSLSHGQKVVAMSDRGMAVGYVNSFPYKVPFKKDLLPINSISKLATDEDIENQKQHYRQEKEVETLCNDLIEKHNLDMNLTHVEFTQYGKKTVFYFTAPRRVDFRGLVKDLVTKLKTRIELRQISLRDRAAAIGGIGPCGRQLCCSSFLSRYGNVNVKLAKNQNLTLNYNKLNGVCGQLKCCLQYEDEVYSHKRKLLPREGQFLQTVGGERGRVERLHLLTEQFEMLTDRGTVKKYSVTQYDPAIELPKDWRFPRKFDHISKDNSEAIGQELWRENQLDELEDECDEIAAKAKASVATYFEELASKYRHDESTGRVYMNEE